MDVEIFLKGVVTGFLIAVPVGPIAVLCIHRILAKGWKHGLISGLGAAMADTVYAIIAAFSLTFISDFLIEHQVWCRLVGAFFLCFFGIKVFLTKAVKKASSRGRADYAGNYWSTFFLTLMNPITISAFVIVFSVLGIASTGRFFEGLLVIGVFIGSSLWWLILSVTTNMLREKIGKSNLVWLNKISGTIITLFGLFILLSLVI